MHRGTPHLHQCTTNLHPCNPHPAPVHPHTLHPAPPLAHVQPRTHVTPHPHPCTPNSHLGKLFKFFHPFPVHSQGICGTEPARCVDIDLGSLQKTLESSQETSRGRPSGHGGIWMRRQNRSTSTWPRRPNSSFKGRGQPNFWLKSLACRQISDPPVVNVMPNSRHTMSDVPQNDIIKESTEASRPRRTVKGVSHFQMTCKTILFPK